MSVLTTLRELQKSVHTDGVQFLCARCGEIKPVQTSGGTGYGYTRDNDPICYTCCGEQDRINMMIYGDAVLYLTCDPAHSANRPQGRSTSGKVSNWPGTLSFPCYTTYGRHNIARYRYDVWFTGPDGYEWHGVQYGDNTQICNVKRTKTIRNGAYSHC